MMDNFCFKPSSGEQVLMFLDLAKDAGIELRETCICVDDGNDNEVYRWDFCQYWGVGGGCTLTHDAVEYYGMGVSVVGYEEMIKILSPDGLTTNKNTPDSHNHTIKQVQELLSGMSDCEVKVEITYYKVVVVAKDKRYMVDEDVDLKAILNCLDALGGQEV